MLRTPPRVMTFLMAGGAGDRLSVLSEQRAKPAVPFGGSYRIIDFALSNCANSGLPRVGVLTQYMPLSLHEHIGAGQPWGYGGDVGGVSVLQPYLSRHAGSDWYLGTADAVYQNLFFLNRDESRSDTVLVLAGDHVYKMDYGPMVGFHAEHNAAVTVGVVQVPISDAREFGVMTTDENNRIIRFAEKPAEPEPMPGCDDVALASMGIYVFDREFLMSKLRDDAADLDSAHDFGRNIIPSLIDSYPVFAYPFQNVETEAQAYWRDVGTVDAFYQANLELVYVSPELNLYDEDWPIWTYQEQVPCAKFVLDEKGRRGQSINSMVAGGCIVSGATVTESLLFYNVIVEEKSEIYRTVVMPHVEVGRGCRIRRAVIDEGCIIPDGMVIGEDPAEDARRFHVTDNGIVLVTRQMLVETGRVAGIVSEA